MEGIGLVIPRRCPEDCLALASVATAVAAASEEIVLLDLALRARLGAGVW